MVIKDINSLIEAVSHANWFSRLGSSDVGSGYRSIGSLRAWDSSVFDKDLPEEEKILAESMDWLPSTFTDIDPFESQQGMARGFDADEKRLVSVVCKQVIAELREVSPRKLVSGPNDFTEAAKGGALFCFRKAAQELVEGAPGKWTELSELYQKGHWPCGLMPSGEVVVF